MTLDPRTARGALLALVRCATAVPELTRGVREIYDFTIGDERFHIIVDHDQALPRSGPSPVSADVTRSRTSANRAPRPYTPHWGNCRD